MRVIPPPSGAYPFRKTTWPIQFLRQIMFIREKMYRHVCGFCWMEIVRVLCLSQKMIFPFSFPLLAIFLSGYSNSFPKDVWIEFYFYCWLNVGSVPRSCLTLTGALPQFWDITVAGMKNRLTLPWSTQVLPESRWLNIAYYWIWWMCYSEYDH